MTNILYLAVGACLIAVIFLGYRFIKSPVWKQRQLQKASKMAAEGKVQEMIAFLEANRDKKSVVCPLTNALVFYFIRSGDSEKAEEIVTFAIKSGDTSGTALAQMAYISQEKGENTVAEKYYKEAMEKDSKLEGTMKVNLAALYINMNSRLDEAEALLEEALEKREGAGRSGVYLNLAMLQMKRKDYSRARVSAMTSAELLPSTPITRMGKAQALGLAARCSVKMKDQGEGRRLASKALKVLDDQPGTDKLKEELLSIIGDNNKKRPQ